MEDYTDIANITDIEALLFSDAIGPRLFVRNDGRDTTFIGILIEETQDSFLVALPCRLLMKEETFLVVPLSLAPYQRMLKAAVHTIMFPLPQFSLQYYQYLTTLERVPEDIQEEVEETIKAYALMFEPKLKEGEVMVELKPNTRLVATPMSMDPDAFAEYLTNKHFAGEVILDGPTTKN